MTESLRNRMWNFWGLRLEGTGQRVTLTRGNDKRSLTLVSDKPGAILDRFSEEEAVAFLAGVWWGHIAEPVVIDGAVIDGAVTYGVRV